MTFAQRRNHLTTHFSESIPVVERRISEVNTRIYSFVIPNLIYIFLSKTEQPYMTKMTYQTWR